MAAQLARLEHLPEHAPACTLRLYGTQVADVSVLAGCSSLHKPARLTDVSAQADCVSLRSLHTRTWRRWRAAPACTRVADVSVPVGCSSLYTLKLYGQGVTDVSTLAGRNGLHTLDLETKVMDVSRLWRAAPACARSSSTARM